MVITTHPYSHPHSPLLLDAPTVAFRDQPTRVGIAPESVRAAAMPTKYGVRVLYAAPTTPSSRPTSNSLASSSSSSTVSAISTILHPSTRAVATARVRPSKLRRHLSFLCVFAGSLTFGLFAGYVVREIYPSSRAISTSATTSTSTNTPRSARSIGAHELVLTSASSLQPTNVAIAPPARKAKRSFAFASPSPSSSPPPRFLEDLEPSFRVVTP